MGPRSASPSTASRRATAWWLSRNEVEAERVERRREQVFGSAPALCALIAMFAVTVPLLLGQ